MGSQVTFRIPRMIMCLIALAVTAATAADDWPMWGRDAARSGLTTMAIPAELHLHWSRQLPAPRRAWPPQSEERDKLEFDRSYSPVVMGDRLFVASMSTDSLTAYDVATGAELWRYYADGPARLAPAAWNGRVYFIADDGFLRCLDAATGELLWVFDAAPAGHRVLGNERVISMWAARGGPAVKDGTVYFASGVWPFLGTFVYALDAVTGDVQWANKSHYDAWQAQPHGGADAFAGTAPQGYLAVAGERVVVSGGRSFPALFDRRDGSLIRSRVRGPHAGGGYRVRIAGDYYYDHGHRYLLHDSSEAGRGNIADSDREGQRDPTLVMRLPTRGWRFRTDPEEIGREQRWFEPDFADDDWRDDVPIEASWQDFVEGTFHGAGWYRRTLELPADLPAGEVYLSFEGVDEEAWVWLNGQYVGEHAIGPAGWDRPFSLNIRAMVKPGAANQLTVLVKNTAHAAGIWRPVSLLAHEPSPTRISADSAAAVKDQLDGEIYEVLAARGRLFVVTDKGVIYCFGADERAPVTHAHTPALPPLREDAAGAHAGDILSRAGHHEGYALFLGAGDGALLEQTALRSELHIVAIEPDPERLAALRRRFDDAGLYGSRIALLPGAPATAFYPKYISSLLVLPDPEILGRLPDAAFLERVYNWLRPYDGIALLSVTAATREAFAAALAAFAPAAGSASLDGDTVVLRREGPLPDTGQWTHQYADPAQTVMSHDDRVRPPFGPIWFGGPGNEKTFNRHAVSPRPHVAGGRLVILGRENLSARCVFTGRELWVREFPGLGEPFTSLSSAVVAAGAIRLDGPFVGGLHVTLPEAIYLRHQWRVHKLDPATGETRAEWPLPTRPKAEELPDWGHISVSGDVLVVTTNPHIWEPGRLGIWSDESWNGVSSERIVALNRHTGDLMWTRDAQIGFPHNAIASANGMLFVNDRISEHELRVAERRGIEVTAKPRMYALDIRTGKVVWTQESEVFGNYFSYSREHDILIEGGNPSGRRTITEQPISLMIARRGRDGEILWKRPGDYQGPVIIHGDLIYSARPGAAVCLKTGDPKMRHHPITGEETRWSYWKAYGCGVANASSHLLLFRSGAAGFADLEYDGGTGNIGGVRAGCTPNMIAADGVLNAPDFSRGCTCSYQNQTSLGLIHMPEMEFWTANQPIQRRRGGAIVRLGVNFGAPGDRRVGDGALWAAHPSPAPGPRLNVRFSAIDVDALPTHVANVRASAGSTPEGSLDGLPATSWQVQSNVNGWFNAWIRYALSEPVTLDRVEVAWSGPEATQLQIETSMDGQEWTVVSREESRGYGVNRRLVYEFAPVEAQFVRLALGAHDDDSEDQHGRRLRHFARISQVRFGGLANPDAYAYFIPQDYFRKHSLEVDDTAGISWVAASGVRGLRHVQLSPINGGDQPYTVTLHFSEPENAGAGERVFAIYLQGEKRAAAVDVAALAGGADRAITLSLPGVVIGEALRVDLKPADGSRYPPLLSGIELQAETEATTAGR